MVKHMPHQTNRFSVLETNTVGSTKDMLNLQSPVTIDLRTKQVVLEQPPLQPSETPFLIPHTIHLIPKRDRHPTAPQHCR